jgi:hypothetical protein
MAEETEREHFYHAEASAVVGELRLPLVQEIKPQLYAKLPERGGYLSQRNKDYHLEEVISFRSAYTQVAGNRDLKPGHGWSTLATVAIEDLNVLDVVTADRVVGQLSTEHPLVGYVPKLTFLGTRFENLRIAGHPVKLDLDPHLLGEKLENDAPYGSHPGFLERLASQLERIGANSDLPGEVSERYNRLPSTAEATESIECSLVNQAEGSFPGRCFGHVIEVPDFGRIYLATLRVEQSDFQNGVPKRTLFNLTMIELKLGCLAHGSVGIGNPIVNGHTKP